MHEYSIYNLINLFLRILGGHFIFSSPQHKEESWSESRTCLFERTAGSVDICPSCKERGDRRRPRSSSAHAHQGTRLHRQANIQSRILHKKVVLFPLPRSFAGARLTMSVYSRIRQSRQNARGARTAVQSSPCISNWYPKSASNPVEFFSRKRTLDVRYTMSFRITIRGRFAWNARSDLFTRQIVCRNARRKSLLMHSVDSTRLWLVVNSFVCCDHRA